VRHTPGPYAAWREWLDAFAKGTDLPSGHLVTINADMGPHMQERLFRHVSEAFAYRQRRWADAFQRDLGVLATNPSRAVTALTTTMTSARSRLTPLRRFTENLLFPQDLRNVLRSALRTTVQSAQSSLDDSARHAPIELQAVVRNNNLVAALSRPDTTPPPGTPGTGRRVII
jgi:hypothetical protein